MNRLSWYLLQRKYNRKSDRVLRSVNSVDVLCSALSEVDRACEKEYEVLEQEGWELCQVDKAYKSMLQGNGKSCDLGGPVAIHELAGELLGVEDGDALTIEYKGHQIHRPIKMRRGRGINPYLILINADDRSVLGAGIDDVVRVKRCEIEEIEIPDWWLEKISESDEEE